MSIDTKKQAQIGTQAKKSSGSLFWNSVSFLQKNLTWSIPAFMILGLLYGYITNPANLKSLIVPLTFLMVYPMMVNLQIKEVLSKGDTKLQILVQVINFLVVPFVGFGIGKLFFPTNEFVVLGLLLTSLLPTSGMTISWTGFAKGNISAAVKMTVVGLILGSLLTPFYLKVMMGAVVSIPLGDVFQQIFIIVFLPMVAGIITQRFLIGRYGQQKYQKELKQKFPPLSTLGVLGIVFVAMALKSNSIVSNPAVLVQYLMPLVILYGINFILSSVIAKFTFSRNDAIAFVYGSVMRNLSIALAIALNVFKEHGSEIALIIAVAYIIQVQAAAWYIKLTDTIFGKATDEGEKGSIPALSPTQR